ncbi:MAG: hypothetical protein SOY99_04295 [Alloprevotella sp.]|nr:hypothetical protein [Bacteroidales bacterium]MDY3943431.1 hypothetical protein [Alloprevotella sp.]
MQTHRPLTANAVLDDLEQLAAPYFGIVERLRDVLDELAVLPYMEGAGQAETVAGVLDALRTLPEGFAPLQRLAAAECVAAYLATGAAHEVERITDIVTTLLSAFE